MRKNINKDFDVIIIGSGFGGSVSALRLAQKGYRVAVLERGKRYNASDFPKTNWNIRKHLWFPRLFLYGIQCITLFRDLFVIHGTGVGGGSLVYANTHLIPPDKAFDDEGWVGGGWKNRLLPYYDLARKKVFCNGLCLKDTFHVGPLGPPKMIPKSAFTHYYCRFLLLLDAHVADPRGPGIIDFPRENE